MGLSVNYHEQLLSHLEAHYIVFRNVTAASCSTIILNKNIYIPNQKTLFFYPHPFMLSHVTLTFSCQHLIVVGNLHARKHFGHCIFDILLPLTILPDEVKEKSFIAIDSSHPIIQEGLMMMGFRECQFLNYSENMCYYAEYFHTVRNPLPYLTYHGYALVRFHKIIYEKFNIKSKPHNYFLYNRRPTDTRYFANFDSLVSLTKEKYPTIDWKIFPSIMPSLKDAFTLASTAKFIFGATGSNLYMIFGMHPESVCVIAHGDGYDRWVIAMTLGLGLFGLFFNVPNMKHFDKRPNYLDLDTTITCIGYGIYAAQNQKWPSNINDFTYRESNFNFSSYVFKR